MNAELRRAPLCWGQQWAWQHHHLPVKQRSPSMFLVRRVSLAAGVATATVVEALEEVIAGHESLRSTYAPDAAGVPTQVVWPAEARRYAFQTFDEPGGHLAWLEYEQDIATHWPIRACLVRRPEQTDELVVRVHHLAADQYGADLLAEELTAALGPRGLAAPPVRRHPADLAAFEQSRAGQRVHDRAVEYWSRHRDAMRETISALGIRVSPAEPAPPEPAEPAEPATESTFVCVVESTAARRRLAALTEALGCTDATAAISAVGLALGAHLDRDRIVLSALASNRHLSGVGSTICAVAQSAVVPVTLPDRGTLRQCVPVVWRAALNGYRHSYYDRERLCRALDLAAAPPGVNVVQLPGGEGPPRTGHREREDMLTTVVPRGFDGLNFHLRISPVSLVVELRSGAHLLTRDQCTALASRVTSLVAAA